MELGLGSASSDGTPGDSVSGVLRADGVKELSSGRNTHLVDADQKLWRGSRESEGHLQGRNSSARNVKLPHGPCGDPC